MLRLLGRGDERRVEQAPGAESYYTAALLKETGPRGSFYLQRRIRREKPFYRRIAMFGGHAELSDETPEACVIRELQEETGVEFKESELIKLGAVNTFDDRGRGEIGHIYLVDGLNPQRFSKKKINPEGKLLRLSFSTVIKRWTELTPITSFAILQYRIYVDLNHGRE